MPETLTERMARYQRAVAAGDAAAAARIAAESIQPPAPRHAPRPTQTTYPELAKLTQTSYSAICAELDSLRTQNRLLKGQLQQQSAAAYDAQRRLNQSLARIAELDPEQRGTAAA